MGLVHCSFCAKETLDVDGVCQFCGKILKRPFWQRRLRRNEAYGVLIIVVGIALFGYMKPLGILLIVAGIVLGASWLFKRRIQ
ncbi:hypothetical protein L0156_14925 [bacterium]|nr:hypothetical protein [bacterium]